MRWVGIDEAGYGPNLGPLVMTAVIAEGPAESPPDLWNDLAATVCRAGSRDDRLWIDDSKCVYRGGKGLDRLEAATLAALEKPAPSTFSGLLSILGCGDCVAVELDRWMVGEIPFPIQAASKQGLNRPLAGAPWQIRSVRSVVVGPERFNRELGRFGLKSGVHFEAFGRLLGPLWAEPGTTFVRGDKHGGRHYYMEPLLRVCEDAFVVPGDEGASGSRYRLIGDGRRLDLELIPKADSVDGLVALASMVSKLLREHWMAVFNAFWIARIPELRPTAGYPVDAARFRSAIEPLCRSLDLPEAIWWRAR